MAILIPGIEKALASKQKPTEGEIFLLRYLEKHFGDDATVFFQPCFNGDRPDIVVLDRVRGVIIIEVKDWQLSNYQLDNKNNWLLKKNGVLLRSPFKQVHQYKKNFFDIHVNGLLEKSLRVTKFFGLIKPYVYFYGSTKTEVFRFYEKNFEAMNLQMRENEAAIKAKAIDFDSYERRRIYLDTTKSKLERDCSTIAITTDRLDKISFPYNGVNLLYDNSVYKELLRLLNPPFHYANDGAELKYSKEQLKLIKSSEGGRLKVRGLAGSGKTVVLAGRAVEAYKRHEGRVLILTFNITLCSYIHDKVSAVRADFPWNAFDFNNYHRFITMALNNCEIEVKVPDGLNYEGDDAKEARRVASLRDAFLEKNYYCNEKIFEGCDIDKYETILIDEIQDYKPEWIKIIRAYFLEKGGEIVLYGDEHQNIYGRAMDVKRRSKIVEGFGEWAELKKSFRYTANSPIIPLAEEFQNSFLRETYEVTRDESYQKNLPIGILAYGSYFFDEIQGLADQVIQIAKRNSIHPNDISIISSQESILQKLDHSFRTSENHKEKTLCSFPSWEVTHHKKYSQAYKKISASKKKGFNLNSGVMKLSSTHSFKGFESPFIFLIVHEGDSPEIVLTGLTRAKENIIVFMQSDSKYLSFFTKHLDNISTVLN